MNDFFEETGLTQSQFVGRVYEKTGFDLKQPRLSEMLGTGKARFMEVEAIAYAFDISPAWLAFEYGEKRPHRRPARPVVDDEPESVVVPPTARKKRA